MRTLLASILTAAALAALLIGWFTTGTRELLMKQRSILEAPIAEASAEAAALAAELGSKLEQLRATESARPYYQYQNLYHDPRGAHEGPSVIPSPLAEGGGDPLIAAHFQIGVAGHVSVPTINEDVPELSNAERLAADRVLLAELRAAASELGDPSGARLAGAGSPAAPRAPVAGAAAERTAENSAAERAVGALAGRPASPPGQVIQEEDVPTPGAAGSSGPDGKASARSQVSTFDRSSYAQNALPNKVYQRIVEESGASALGSDRGRRRIEYYIVEGSHAGLTSTESETRPLPRRPGLPAGAPPERGRRGGSVEIITLPFEWRTVDLGGLPCLLALRRVETPDGTMTQGFLIDTAVVQEWLSGRRMATMPASLHPGSPGPTCEAALPIGGSPWRVSVDSDAAFERAGLEAGAVLGRFLRGFVPVALLSLAAGALVVVLVARAERLAHTRAQFAAAAAHELRTPLAGIQLHGDMLAGGLGDPTRSREYARRVADEAERLGRVVGNVLGFTQLERGSLVVRPVAGDLSGVVRACCERLRAGLEDAGTEVVIDVQEGLRARHDPDAVGRILQNLLDNAEKYARGATDRTVHVSARATGGRVEVAVADHGPGLRRGDARRLFRPFRRGHDSGDRPAGLGLGLALARSLARAQDGDLIACATPGGGATFVLTLPSA